MPIDSPGSQAPYRYLYRSHKPKFRYHIAADRGTACKMENGTSIERMDESANPPSGRVLCQMCAQALGLPTPTMPDLPPATPAPHKINSRADKLLAYFGVSITKNHPDFKPTNIRVAQEQFVKRLGAEFPGLSWQQARCCLGELKKRGTICPPGRNGYRAGLLLGSPTYLASAKAARERQAAVSTRKDMRKAAKKLRKEEQKAAIPRKQAKPAKVSRHGLTPERVAFIISDAFLQSFEWRQVRYDALKKNNGRCELCGMGKKEGVVLNVDHIKPRRRYPELALDPEWLQVLCSSCNHGKGNRDETDWR